MGKVPSAALGLSVLLLIPMPAPRGTAIAQTADPNTFGDARPPEVRGWLVEVPYVSQTKALCGGAAAAMVLRYWGERGVYAEHFSKLVDPSEEGIPTEALTRAIQERGWWAAAFRGSPQLAQSHLAQGRPLLVLLEERPGDYHYVGLIGWLPGRVVVHDPARAPYRLLDEDEFQTAWAGTNFWTLLILPLSHDGSEEVGPVASRFEASGPFECSDMVEEGVRVASGGNLDAAEELLLASAELCPAAAAPLRELAGIRFRQSRWGEAAHLAERAVARDRTDAHAWRTLAASRFLEQHTDAALRAWNEVDELRIDLLRVDGLTRTRYEVVARSLDVPEGELLTPERLGLARRRLSELPVETGSRVSYRPVTGGLAEVEASLVERRLWPGYRTALIAGAMDAAVDRELSLNLSSPSGGGELWSGGYRFWEERPKASLALAVPRPWGLPGVWQVQGSWERQSYGADVPAESSASTDILVREERRRASLMVSDWWSVDSRWKLRAGLDHWEERGRYVFAGGGLEKRLASDRVAIRFDTAGWLGRGSHAFGVASLTSGWRSSTSERGFVAHGGVQMATSSAPPDLWPGAGTGHAREPLLRAHPLLVDGVVRGDAFGRTLVHGGIESHTGYATTGFARFGLALFADVGRAWNPLANHTAPMQVDVGAGLRLKLIGDRRALRVDTAWGLRDGEFALTIGWVLPWPGWR